MSPPAEFLPFHRPSLGPEEEQAVLSVLRSGWLTTGEVCRRFEEEFASWCGVSHALAVSSATAGLHLALEAVAVKAGDLVATTPYSFASTGEVIRYLGAHPLFVDVEEDSLNISPELLEAALRRERGRVSALMPVHVAGLPCRMPELLEVARARGLAVVEDAAHCLPRRGVRAEPGTLGELGVYSFYATKPITTGEGGMVVTAGEELARRVRLMRLHGIDREVWDRYRSPSGSWYYEVQEPGFKYNLPDLTAAIGRVQLAKADELRAARVAIAGAYQQAFADLDCLQLPAQDPRHSWHLYLIRLRAQRLSLGRDEFIQALRAEGIGASVHFIPLHAMPYYRRTYGLSPADFPVAWSGYLRALSLPIFPGMSEEQVQRVIQAVTRIALRHRRAQAR